MNESQRIWNHKLDKTFGSQVLALSPRNGKERQSITRRLECNLVAHPETIRALGHTLEWEGIVEKCNQKVVVADDFGGVAGKDDGNSSAVQHARSGRPWRTEKSVVGQVVVCEQHLKGTALVLFGSVAVFLEFFGQHGLGGVEGCHHKEEKGREKNREC